MFISWYRPKFSFAVHKHVKTTTRAKKERINAKRSKISRHLDWKIKKSPRNRPFDVLYRPDRLLRQQKSLVFYFERFALFPALFTVWKRRKTRKHWNLAWFTTQSYVFFLLFSENIKIWNLGSEKYKKTGNLIQYTVSSCQGQRAKREERDLHTHTQNFPEATRFVGMDT